ncbi:MAG: glycosyltransferase family 39 protein, partial [Burkholderiales bacterium]
ATVIALACPIIEAVFFVVTPDSPLLMFWALTLYCFYIGIFEDKAKYIYLAGFFAGCDLLSKYTAVLIFPGLFLFLITSKRHWQYLLRKELYLAFLLSLIIFVPVIIWNYQHGWVSFLFQLRHGMEQNRVFNLSSFSDYVGGQLVVASPILFLAILYYMIRYFKPSIMNDKLSFLVWPFILPVGFFGYCGLFQHMEANWPGPAYISSLIFLAYWLVKFDSKWVYRTSIVFIFIVLTVTKLPTLFTPKRFHNRVPGLNIFYGNKEMLAEVKPYLTPDTVVLGCDYGNASRAWYYLGLKRAYVLDKFPFANTYRYWNNELSLPIKKAIYVCDGDDQLALAALHQYFAQVQLVKVATFSNVITDNKAYIYQVDN